MKKVLSIIVVLCTILSVTLMITISNNRNKTESRQPKVEVFKPKEKNANLELKGERNNNETAIKNIEKEEGKNRKERKEESNFYKWTSYKEVKREYIYGEIQSEKEIIKMNVAKVEEIKVERMKDEKAKEIAVLNSMKVNKEAKLTEKEKENLLFLSKKLSAVDHWKIKECIESDNMEILRAIYLMESKLSKKESEGLKEIANRFSIEKIN